MEDFDIQGVRELTRPLFAIPTHQFLFHGGKVDKRFYMDNLQLESAEYDLISAPQQASACSSPAPTATCWTSTPRPTSTR